MRAHPAAFSPGFLVSGAGRVQGDAAVQPIDDDIDRTGLRRASPAQDRVGAFDLRSPEVGGNPYVGAQPQCGQRDVEELAAAVRSLTSRGVISVVIGRLWDFSKSRSAAPVSGPAAPSAFNE